MGQKTPYFLIDEAALEKNLQILKSVSDATGAKILLAQKAYSCFATYPLIAEYLDGTAASGLYEARLGKEHFGKETHVFSAAFCEEEIEELAKYCDHVIFNSPAQVKKFAPFFRAQKISCGLRVNPEHSTQHGHAQYDPCAPFSRLGTTLARFDESALPLLDGLHMHTLCEQNSDALEETVEALEEKFGKYLSRLCWLNLGGGHHITRGDYDIPRLISILVRLREKYGVQIYLEPGEAVVLNAGTLVSRVLDIVENGMNIAVLDASAACHMPDVLEMPYRPPVRNGGAAHEKKFTYRLAGPTCLAGDIIGDYSFDTPLHCGDEIIFEDMALYTMVKTNTFNGMPLPAVALKKKDGKICVIKTFSYENFKARLS